MTPELACMLLPPLPTLSHTAVIILSKIKPPFRYKVLLLGEG